MVNSMKNYKTCDMPTMTKNPDLQHMLFPKNV